MTKSFKDRAIFLDGDDDPQTEDDSPGGGDCQGHPVHALCSAYENFITAASDSPLINAQSKMPCNNDRGPTFRSACRLSPAPIRNRVSVIPTEAIRVS